MALGIAVLLLGAWIVVLVLHPVARYVVGPPPMLALAVVMEGTASLCDPKHENAILVTRLLAILFVGLAVFILIWVI